MYMALRLFDFQKLIVIETFFDKNNSSWKKN